eukprot:TRINITY_DN6867_c0_g1_i1.p1 TRINITY_DN6867_c0_g1~~TRINITY_DN6867_c0_g1_i1.p1  ORF type:complete len:929 (-),score=236.83 TRINITY_DN6867_c0_g1_i1:47-2833(-)
MSVIFGSKYGCCDNYESTLEDEHIAVYLSNKTSQFYEDISNLPDEIISDPIHLLDVPQDAYNVVTSGTLEPYVPPRTYMSTIGAAFKIASNIHTGDGNNAKVQLWDTAGQERFRSIGRMYYRGSHLVLLVYDITVETSGSLNNLRRWLDDIRTGGNENENTIIIIGNKTDLEYKREVDFGVVQRFAKSEGIFAIEVSAKEDYNLERAFSRAYSETYMLFWRKQMESFGLVKAVFVGDSGVGKTTLYERLSGFSCDLAPLAEMYPLSGGNCDIDKSLVPSIYESKEKLGEMQNSGKMIKKWIKRKNTNIFLTNFGHLGAWKEDITLATGDPMQCSCGAIFGPFSDYEELEDYGIWTCSYCFMENELDLDEHRNMEENVDFLVEGTPTASKSEKLVLDSSLVIFCLDTSGSMIVSSSVPKSNYDSKVFKKKEIDEAFEGVDTPQYLPNENRDIVYVSRLEALKAAVESQLIQLQSNHPNRRVALVTFSNDVSVYIPGYPTVNIAGDMLDNEEKLSDISSWWGGESISNPPQIIESRSDISEKLFSLKEGGRTALGPALVVSNTLAKAIEGESSKILICTDGLANVGVGSMEENDYHTFYTGITDTALENDTTLSLVSFEGSDCNIENLGEIVNKTGGSVDIVDPTTIQKNFKNIFADNTIATKVEIRLFVSSPGVVLSDITLQDGWSKIEECPQGWQKFVGGINPDSNLTVEFDLIEGLMIDKEEVISFQIHIKYTRIEDGNTLLRVISKKLPIIYGKRGKSLSLLHSEPEAISSHAISSVAKIAQRGEYTTSRLQNRAYLDLMEDILETAKNNNNSSNVKYTSEEVEEVFRDYVRGNTRFERTLVQETRREIRNGIKTWDDAINYIAEREMEPEPFEPGFFGFVKGIFSSNDTKTELYVIQPNERDLDIITERNETRPDDLSNFLWNMR